MAGLKRVTASEAGFTVLELLVVCVMTIALLTLGAFAVRHFWLVRSLQGAQDVVVTQLRQVQQRSAAESYPNVYGLAVLPDKPDFSVVRGNATDNSCVVLNRQKLEAGVKFNAGVPNTTLGTASTMVTNCRTQLGGTGTYVMVFMYPKGSSSVGATASTQTIELSQPAIGRTRSVKISPLTGRVTRI